MVSSKCCQVESPSPFRSLAALMPPCAQTECERFTGTIENRSTVPPASAILITAASPASPPPTTPDRPGRVPLPLSSSLHQPPRTRWHAAITPRRGTTLHYCGLEQLFSV